MTNRIIVDERMHVRTLRESESLRFRSHIVQSVTRLSSNRRNRSEETPSAARPSLHHSLLEAVASDAKAIARLSGELSFSSGFASASTTPTVQTSIATPRSRKRDVERDATYVGIVPSNDRSPLEIVWRKRERANASSDNRDEGAASSNHLTRSESNSGQTNSQTIKPQERDMGKAPVPQVSTAQISIDSKMLDRLTDDVIRRVERKLRIDRERRGLGN